MIQSRCTVTLFLTFLIVVANLAVMIVIPRLLNRESMDYGRYLFYLFIVLGATDIALAIFAVYKRLWIMAAVTVIFSIACWLLIESGSG